MIGIWLGKLADIGLRMAGRRATSLPGKVALKFSPHVLKRLGQQLERCVVVTGTNGKTTTASLLASILAVDGPLVHNVEGANMQQGLTSALLRHTSILGRLKRRTALLEIDEATLPLVASLFPVQVAVVTNVFRDQLDRYGELDTTMNKIREGLAETSATLILNADDPLARHIGLQLPNQSYYFGLSAEAVSPQYRDQVRDGTFCLTCGHPIEYQGFFYGQLGVYRCPNCDFHRPHPDFEGAVDGGKLVLRESDVPEVIFPLPVRGMFNVYNVLAAVSAARVCGMNFGQIQTGLGQFQAPLGRMQAFATTPGSVLNLIKNPTGCDSVLQAICTDPDPKVVCIAINDLAADGKDVSWLWDADFEMLAEDKRVLHCVTTGLRSEDMALRLKYAGYPPAKVSTVSDLEAAIDETLQIAADAQVKTVYFITTYTNLYPASEYLQKRRNHESSAANRASVS